MIETFKLEVTKENGKDVIYGYKLVDAILNPHIAQIKTTEDTKDLWKNIVNNLIETLDSIGELDRMRTIYFFRHEIFDNFKHIDIFGKDAVDQVNDEVNSAIDEIRDLKRENSEVLSDPEQWKLLENKLRLSIELCLIHYATYCGFKALPVDVSEEEDRLLKEEAIAKEEDEITEKEEVKPKEENKLLKEESIAKEDIEIRKEEEEAKRQERAQITQKQVISTICFMILYAFLLVFIYTYQEETPESITGGNSKKILESTAEL